MIKRLQEKYSVTIFVTIQDSGSLNIFGRTHIPLLSLHLVNQNGILKKKKIFACMCLQKQAYVYA